MNVYVTTDQRIDRAGKHILTPSAFAEYVSTVTWRGCPVPDVSFTPDTSVFVLPVGYHYAFIEYSIGELDAFRVYYFVEPAAPFEPHAQSAADATVYARYNLRVDWPHTLGMGSTNWSTLLSSHITRSRILPFVNGQYENVRDQPTTRYFPAIGQTQEYVAVLLWVIKESDQSIFGEPAYRYLLGVTHRAVNSQQPDTFGQCLGIIQSFAGYEKMDRIDGPGQFGATISASLVSAWVVPAAYVPASIWGTYPNQYPYYHAYYNAYPVTLDAYQSVSISLSGVDMARRAYAIGNGSLDVQLSQTSDAVNSPTVNTYLNPITGPKITATIEGQTYDLTNYCLVPFSIIDQSAVSAINQQRLLAAASTAISIGVGVVSQNPVAVAGGIINGARQQIDTPSSVPARSSGGDCFAQFDGSTYALLRLKSYHLTAASRVANVTRGPMGALPVPSSTAISGRLVDLASLGCIYIEGDIHHTYTGSGPEAPIFSAFEDQMAAAYADGVYFWTSVARYRGVMPA